MGTLRPMPTYQCHKQVSALKIKKLELNKDGTGTITPEEKGYKPFNVEFEYLKKHNPHEGGYYVVYEDGYHSFSPAKAFQEGYSNLNNGSTKLDTIQHNISVAKEMGLKVNKLSDGYHSFNELYAYRKAYNALLFNEWAARKKVTVETGPNGEAGFRSEHAPKYDVHKSLRHSDGEPCFDGTYFVVVAMTPYGQISNHYKLKYWDDFKISEEPKAKYEYDGHTSQDALERMEKLISES